MATFVEFDHAAREEFDEAFDWYAGRNHGAVVGFAAAIDEALDRIVADPERFPQTFAGCQYCSVKRYPYCVVYYRSQRGLHAVAIAHAKRRPGY